ncbi:uncharacterized protein METZ01_LOCUS417303, partial [marine metagenome]
VSKDKHPSLMLNTRYYRFIRPAFFYGLCVILPLLVLETGSLIAVSFSASVEEKIPYLQAISRSWNLHPWNAVKENSEKNYFHPITQVRGKSSIPWKALNTNEYGFIHNGHNISLLNSFPEKPEG